MDLVSKVKLLLAVLTVLSQILVVLGLFVYFFPKRVKALDNLFNNFLSQRVFVIPVIATIGSLFYSEIAHYTPCVLCWYQRVLMYPQAIILSIAYWRKDKSFTLYSIILSVIGAVIALYHYLLQTGIIKEFVPCSLAPQAVDCAKKVTMTFGYISIPMMALSAFLLIIVLQALNLRNKKS
jgi:disulfide bond formation protein DsbB